MPVQTGRRLGRYILVSRLGAGGMGEVFEADDAELGRRVAVKVLTGSGAAPAGAERFAAEARAVARLSHPNILAIHDVGTADGMPFAVMERLEGRTLRAVLDEGRVELHTALDYATQIVRGLAAAHAKAITHRDIKPENVFVTDDGLVKILDFGIAAMRDGAPDNQALTIDLPAQGTAGYLAPEQARGRAADHRADIFSFGAVLYELLTGAKAFAGETTIDALHAVLHSAPAPVAQLRPDLPDAVQRIVARCLARAPEDRYQSTPDLLTDLEHARERSRAALSAPRRWPRSWRWAPAIMLAVLALVVAMRGMRVDRRPSLQGRDRVLIGHVANLTRDPIFDGTLKQGLEVQLGQSPFLNLVPPSEVASALTLMGRRADEPVTPAIARDLCLRNGVKAFITGSITPMGQSYVIGLEAVAAADGVVIAREQVQADRKEDILHQLGAASTRLRETLGESLPSIRKFDAPIEQATTSSLDALRAYAAGVEQTNRGRYQDALTAYRRATELDPEFALAYQALAREQYNVSFSPLIEDAATRAFALRARTTENENLRISSFYHLVVTRNLTKAIEIAELWRQTYPSQWQPHHALSDLYFSIGRYDESIAAADEAIRLNPKVGPAYSNRAGALIVSGRFQEAKATYERAQQLGLDAPEFHFYRFWIDPWLDDLADQPSQIEWLERSAQPQIGTMLRSQAAAYAGHWRESRQWTARAIEGADRAGRHDAATQLAVFDAPNAAVVQDCAAARALASRAIASVWPLEQMQAALAFALCCDAARALRIADRFTEHDAADTLLQGVWIPAVRAAAALTADAPDRALADAERAATLGRSTIWPDLIRGRALLQLGRNADAVRAFAAVNRQRGRFGWTYSIYPMSHLWLARAAARAGDRTLAGREYDAFLTMWKDADRDLRPLTDARREYALLTAAIR